MTKAQKTAALTGGQMTPHMLRRSEVIKLTGLSDSTIWRMEAKGTFPKRVQLSVRRVGWRYSEVSKWLEAA